MPGLGADREELHPGLEDGGVDAGSDRQVAGLEVRLQRGESERVGAAEPARIDDWSKMKYRRFIDAAGGWDAFQTVLGWPEDGPRGDRQRSREKATERPGFIDGCHAWSADGEVVAKLYPRFSTRGAKPGPA